MRFWRTGLAVVVALCAIAQVANCGDIKATASKDEKTGEVTLGNQEMRIRFHLGTKEKYGVFPDGYTGYVVEVKSKAKWTTMATCPSFSSFVYRSGWGRDILHYVMPSDVQCKQEANSATAQFTQTLYDFDGNEWKFILDFSIEADKPVVNVSYNVTASQRRELLLLWGPKLYAGEGSFGDTKDEALFAGLEYLRPGDSSSYNPSFAPDAQMYFAPDPRKITIPLMAVVKDGNMVGMMWDPLQKWNGADDCPTAIFASPNWIERKSNSLMGLYLPSIPKYVPENGFRASTPAIMEAGKPITLSAQIFAAQGKRATDAVDLYIAEKGILEPAKPPMSRDKALDMLTRAVAETSWNEAKKGWAWIYGYEPERNPKCITSLVRASSLVSDPALAKRAIDIAETAANADPGKPLLVALRDGGVEQCLKGLQGEIKATVAAQKSDGAWEFVPGIEGAKGLKMLFAPEKPGVIAPDNYRSQGITAEHTARILDDVLITSDEAGLKAALKGIDDLEKYSVPYVGETLECPPAPSLHGSYLGLQTYLDAYRITGDREYLDKAVYWAKTGLPFIYLWSLGPREVPSGFIHTAGLYPKGSEMYNDPVRDVMPYASLYGYGSSQFIHHWYALPVQWIGLVYARDVLDLARYDSTLPWKKIADGIVTSCLWQTTDKGPYIGYWPDGFNLQTWMPSGPFISPAELLNSILYCWYDKDTRPRTEVVREGKNRCHVTTADGVENLKLSGSVLSFSLNQNSGSHTRAIIAGLPDKCRVSLDGKQLASSDNLEISDECWTRTADGFTLIKMLTKEKSRAIVIRPETK